MILSLRLTLAFTVLLTAFAGAGLPDDAAGDALKPGSHARIMMHGGVKRTYRLYLPKDLPEGPAPLVLAFHGALTDGLIMEVLTGFNKLADKKGFVVVYPDGIGRVWRFWSKEDVDFTEALIDDLVAKKRVDPRRVYATGISNGAYFSNRLGYDLSQKIAAIAPVAGTMIKIQADTAPKQRLPMPVLSIHGTADRITGYDGKDMITQKATSVPAEDFVAWWAKRNRCANPPKVEKLPVKVDSSILVERWSFAPKKEKDRAEVIFYKVIGGGHTWPGDTPQPEFLLGRTCKDFNASATIWEFFARHKRSE